MGTDQCAVVISLAISLLKLKPQSRSIQSQAEKQGRWVLGHGVAPMNRGATESDIERELTGIQCNWHSRGGEGTFSCTIRATPDL